MTPSLISSNPMVSSDRSSTRRKRKKKIQKETSNQAENLDQNSAIQWKSEAQQQIYSSKLIHALQQVRLHSGGGGSTTPSPKRVSEAAYRALAATAKGRSIWSRAILTNRLKLKFMKKNNTAKRQRRVMTVITTVSSQLQKKSKVSVPRLRSKGLPAFQRKARTLSRLVPGCRKQPFQVVLEETIDYIPALEMQIRTMAALAEFLSVAGSSSSGSAIAFNHPGSNRNLPN